MKKLLNFLKANYAFIYKVFLLVITITLIVFFFPNVGQFKYDYQVGKPWMYTDLIAPYNFPIYKTAKVLEQEKSSAMEEFSPYFKFDQPLTDSSYSHVKSQFSKLWAKEYGLPHTKYSANLDFTMQLFHRILDVGVLGSAAVEDDYSGFNQVFLIRENSAEKRDLASFYTVQKADKEIERAIYNRTDTLRIIKKAFVYKLLQEMLPQNVVYDKLKTDEAKSQLIDNISLTRGMVQKGERIIGRGEVVTNEIHQVLQSYKSEYLSKSKMWGDSRWIKAGQAMVISILMLILFMFYYYFRQSLFGENKKIIFIFFIMLLIVLFTSLIVKYNVEFLYVIPVAIVPLLIRIFFDSRLAIVIQLITILILGFLAPESFTFVILNIVAGLVGIMSMVNIHRRAQFFITAFWIFLSYSIMYTGISLIQGGGIQNIDYMMYGIFAANAVLTLFAYPLIYIFERVFGMVTDITLLELSDTNSPLLRRLLTKSPGTFQHVSQVANLAEEAIREIGGNALLVRAGAMYHDIGKMDMPMYFIENQRAGMNPHDDLTYQESARIIISHVIKGVEMAKRQRLPEQVIDFIRTHHGTRRADYFYLKHKEKYPDEVIDESIFTYHGPKPFSKETAVLMMADSVEAASRSISAPNENKINALVDGIIDKLMAEGQLSNADITFKDISIVKKVLKRQLMNIYHVRIPYPEK